MAFTSLVTTQNKFLESYLRGTGRTLTEAQAAATFGVMNLTARLSEMRQLGLQVKRVATKTTSRSAYRISRRTTFGSQAKTF